MRLHDIAEGKLKPIEGNTIPLPDVRQQTTYSCGPSALWAICRYHGVGPDTEAEFREITGADPDDGVSPDVLIATARRFGLRPQPRQRMDAGDLQANLDRRIPVIICLQAWGDGGYSESQNGHYAVAIGYDSERVYFEDPSLQNARGFIPWDELLTRWHDAEADGTKYVRYGIAIAGPHPGTERSASQWAQKVL